ncbi:MAG: Clp protease N-terminal domain-containing protein, partial [Planctomycetota bacterium]
MFDRFTDRARKVMGLARQEAQRFNHEYIGTEHILLGLVQEGSGVAANVLKNMDVDLKKIRQEVEKLVQTGNNLVTMGQLPFTPRAKKVLELSLEEANNLGHNYIGTEHLLLGLLRESESVAAKVLTNLGLKLEDVRDEVLDFLGAEPLNPNTEKASVTPPTTNPKSKTPALDSFGRDLTELAREQKLDPVIGRTREIERVITI